MWSVVTGRLFGRGFPQSKTALDLDLRFSELIAA